MPKIQDLKNRLKVSKAKENSDQTAKGQKQKANIDLVVKRSNSEGVNLAHNSL